MQTVFVLHIKHWTAAVQPKIWLIYSLQAVEFVEASIDHINCYSKELRRLFLVEDIVDSIKVYDRMSSALLCLPFFYSSSILNKIQDELSPDHFNNDLSKDLFIAM